MHIVRLKGNYLNKRYSCLRGLKSSLEYDYIRIVFTKFLRKQERYRIMVARCRKKW